jgi:hypothetical protein
MCTLGLRRCTALYKAGFEGGTCPSGVVDTHSFHRIYDNL